MLCKLLIIFNLLCAQDSDHEASRFESRSTTEEQVYSSIPELLQALSRTQRQTLKRTTNTSDGTRNCCGITGGFHACVCGEVKIIARLFWTITKNTTWTISSLSNYIRRSMIPLVAFGEYDKTLKDKLLMAIGILQIVSETTEAIYDFSSNRLTTREKQLTTLHRQRKEEKKYAETKALIKLTQGTIPHLKMTETELTNMQAKRLRRLYEPESRALSAIEKELAEETQLTGCEGMYNRIRLTFWTKSYPVFWIVGVGLSLAQMLVIASDLADSKQTLTLAILLISIEALKYFSDRMKHIGQDEDFHHHKLRKIYEDPDADDMV